MKLVLGLFGLENFYGGDVKSYIEIAQMGEELGFDAVSVTDHVVMGKNLHKYPFGQRESQMPHILLLANPNQHLAQLCH